MYYVYVDYSRNLVDFDRFFLGIHKEFTATRFHIVIIPI